jgi:hypothetical protein
VRGEFLILAFRQWAARVAIGTPLIRTGSGLQDEIGKYDCMRGAEECGILTVSADDPDGICD